MKIKNIIWLALVLVACAEGVPYEVQHAGAMKKIKHEGDFSAQISLDTLAMEHLFALGAVENLKGEITVLDGSIYVSEVADSMVVNVKKVAVPATLLAYSYISDWETISINIETTLEAAIEKVVKEKNIAQPLPFKIAMTPYRVNYHIINFDSRNGDRANHKSGALNDVLSKRRVTLLGFYATDARGIYTHHDSNVHLHFVEESTGLTGHVDELDLGTDQVKLMIPKQ